MLVVLMSGEETDSTHTGTRSGDRTRDRWIDGGDNVHIWSFIVSARSKGDLQIQQILVPSVGQNIAKDGLGVTGTPNQPIPSVKSVG